MDRHVSNTTCQRSMIKTKTTLVLRKLVVIFFTVMLATAAFSNPSLNSVTSGNVSVSQSGNTTTVNQASQQAIIQWNSFNIAAQEKTQFIQPNSSSIALNRINPQQGASQIYGQLSSNGRIILINGAGIHFGPGSQVNVGSLIASTSDISNANFLAGKYIFDQASQYNGSIVNEGEINAKRYGLVALLGDSVSNSGVISARLGSIAIGSGSAFTLDFNGDQLINFTVDGAASAASTGVINSSSGKIFADGGKILITASAAQGVLDNVIDMDGVAQTQSVSQQNGEIILSGGANQERLAAR
jgi:filamentous hemagglutinin family protein